MISLKKKARTREYPTRTMIDTDDLMCLANTPAQAESQHHNLEHAAGGISLPVNANKTSVHVF